MKVFLLILFSLIFLSPDNRDNFSDTNPRETSSLAWQSIDSTLTDISTDTPPAVFPSPGFVAVKTREPQKITLAINNKRQVQPLEIPFTPTDSLKKESTDVSASQPGDKVTQFAISPRTSEALMPVVIKTKDPVMKTLNPFSFRFHTRIQGLPHDDISNIEFDHKGNMWIGTYGAGLIRYDGVSFYQYTIDHGLPDNFINSLTTDSQGRVIFGTRIGGMVIFDGNDFMIYSEKEGFPRNRIEALFEDSNGNIWIGTYGSGIVKFDGTKFTNYESVAGISDFVVYSIASDTQGNLWFATRGNGILMYDGESFEHVSSRNGLPGDFTTSVCVDKNNNLWIGTDGAGLVSFNGDRFLVYDESGGFPENAITSVFEDHSGRIWAGTYEAGLLYLEGTDVYFFGEQEGLINSFITDICQDKGNQMWIGTYGSGIGAYFGNVFRHYSEYDGIPAAFIRAIAEDQSGSLWMGMNTSGLIKFNFDHILHYTNWHGLADDRVRTIFEDSRGRLWIGFLYKGLSVFDGDRFYTFANHPLLMDIGVTAITETSNGAIWIGTHGDGVFKLHNEEITHYTLSNGLPDMYIRKIIADKNDNIFIASRESGIIRFDGKAFTVFSAREGFPANDILDILIDDKGVLWAGTNGSGLVKFEKGKFLNFTEKHGLGSNFVYSVLEDNNGQMWIGTRWGLSQFLRKSPLEMDAQYNHDIDQAYASGIFFKNYSWSDGFHGVGVNSRAMLQHTNGTIWIGANDLITAFRPDQTTLDSMPPQIYLTSLDLYNEAIAWKNVYEKQDTLLMLSNGMQVSQFDFDGISPWFGIPMNLELPHRSNYLVFNYVAVPSRYQQTIRYQYYLEGLEQNWGPFTTRTEAQYGNLKPGRYTFRLRAMNNAGVFSNELSYDFRIIPPWYSRWWAFLIYACLFVAVVFLVIRYRRGLQREKEHQKQEELLLHQQIEIARKSAEFKQNFLANMSHEIRTPLTGILGMAELLRNTPLNETQEDYLKTLIFSGENLKETINLVLDYSKIEAGKVKLNNEVFSVEKLFERGEKLFISVCRKDIAFGKHIPENLPPFIISDYNRILQIINNLISNAVKFTEKGNIALKAELVEGEAVVGKECMMKISVSDTGKGIRKSEQSNIFKPFYQSEQENDRPSDGTGLGLAICKELSKILGGDIGFTSRYKYGSEFWFTFKCTVAEAPRQETDYKEKKNNNDQSLRILLVEDKVVNQKVIGLMLQAMNHKVTLAINGEEAVRIFNPGMFDLVLMDIQMPVMDGIAATIALRKKYGNFLPPIVGLSANAFEGDRERYMKHGLDEYLTKPVKQTDFTQLITKLNL